MKSLLPAATKQTLIVPVKYINLMFILILYFYRYVLLYFKIKKID